MRFLSRTRTVNALFPVAQHFLQVSFSALQCLNVCLDTLELALGKSVHATAWSTPSITSFQNFSQLSQSESDPESPLDDKNSLQRARRLDSVTRLCSRGSWQNTDPFIMSNCVWTHTRRLGQGPGTKSCGTATLHHEKYEPWNAFQGQGICSRSVFGPRLRTRQATIRSDSGYSARAKSTHIRTQCIPLRNLIPVGSSEHIAKSVLIRIASATIHSRGMDRCSGS